MADLATILTSLTEEIILAITAIEPNTMAGELNMFKSPLALEKQDIREQSGNPRLFQVLWGSPKQMDGGHTEKTWDVPGTVTIGYPVKPEWHVARASDVQQIFNRLNVEDHGIAGVNYRHVPQGEEIPEPELANDDWSWLVIPLRTVVTTS